MKYCSNCGKEIHDKAVFCVHCGCAVETAASNSEHSNEYNRLMTFVREMKTVHVLGVISLVLCMGIGLIFQLINLPKINKYWKKAEKAYVFPEFNLTNPYDIELYENAKKKFKQGEIMTSIGLGVSISLIFFAFLFGIVMPAILVVITL